MAKPITVTEAARRLKRRPDLVRRWIRERRLRATRFGWSWSISEREIARFLRHEPERRQRR